MGFSIETATVADLSMSVLPGANINDVYAEEEFGDIDQALVLEDAVNCQAIVLVGTDDELEKFAVDILERIKRKPMVLVVENPDADPSVYAHGPVEVDEASSYPATDWADDEVDEYAEYAEEHRERAATYEAQGATAIADALRCLADDFENEHGVLTNTVKIPKGGVDGEATLYLPRRITVAIEFANGKFNAGFESLGWVGHDGDEQGVEVVETDLGLRISQYRPEDRALGRIVDELRRHGDFDTELANGTIIRLGRWVLAANAFFLYDDIAAAKRHMGEES